MLLCRYVYDLIYARVVNKVSKVVNNYMLFYLLQEATASKGGHLITTIIQQVVLVTPAHIQHHGHWTHKLIL